MASRRKDGGVPRRKHGNCNKPLRQRDRGVADDAFEDKPSSSSAGQREKPPAHLKGKALGLWYRDRQVTKNKKEEEDRVPGVLLPRKTFDEIDDLLYNVGKESRQEQNRGLLNENIMLDSNFKDDFLDKVRVTFAQKIASDTHIEEAQQDQSLDRQLKKTLLHKMETDKIYSDMLKTREKLPCYKKKEKLLRAISDNQVVVISGETGCGKTTQIAQFVLDDETLNERGSVCNILCTQPRRISAISVAERVACERNEPLGEAVGYQIRLEKKLPKRTRGTLTFVTTGILLQYLQSNPTLKEYSHLFIDEVHERDVLCDFVLACLLQIIAKRPKLKVILMSATLNAERFSTYFNSAPCLHVPGFTYDVEEIYLDQIIEKTGFKFKPNSRPRMRCNIMQSVIMPHIRELLSSHAISKATAEQLENPESERINTELMAAVIQHICLYEDEGAILVFVPGLSDIQYLHKQLLRSSFFNRELFIIITLHSTLPTLNQRKVFDRPKKGVRKIVIATNIAETSITIDDVVFVVDSGFIKMTNFDMDLNVSSLDSQWVSLANAKQRRGRAGRVGPGKCYKLYTLAREFMFDAFPVPEIQRTRLEEVVLQVKMLQLGNAAIFLRTLIDPPELKALDMAISMLMRLNALDEEENLTPLGYHLTKLPVDPQAGKMILMSAIFGCVDPILTIASALSFKDPFSAPIGMEQALRRVKENLADHERSDHLILSKVMQLYEEACQYGDGRDFAYRHFVSENILRSLNDMKKQFARNLHEMNFLLTPSPKDTNGNVNSDNVELVKAIICAGLYPNVALLRSVKPHRVLLKTVDHYSVELHSRSVCSNESRFKSPMFVYHKMLKTSAKFLHDVTVVSPWALLFFGERLDIIEFREGHAIRVDHLIRVQSTKKTGVLVQKLRKRLDWILSNCIFNPGVINWNEQTISTRILEAIVKLITSENEEH